VADASSQVDIRAILGMGPKLRPGVIFECVGVPGVIQQILDGAMRETRVADPRYHLWVNGADNGAKGWDNVRQFYIDFLATKTNILEYDVERDDATLAAAVKLAHRHGKLAIAHITTAEGAQRAVDAGVDGST
jgi:hypothetical protein